MQIHTVTWTVTTKIATTKAVVKKGQETKTPTLQKLVPGHHGLHQKQAPWPPLQHQQPPLQLHQLPLPKEQGQLRVQALLCPVFSCCQSWPWAHHGWSCDKIKAIRDTEFIHSENTIFRNIYKLKYHSYVSLSRLKLEVGVGWGLSNDLGYLERKAWETKELLKAFFDVISLKHFFDDAESQSKLVMLVDEENHRSQSLDEKVADTNMHRNMRIIAESLQHPELTDNDQEDHSHD